jgi:alpha-galactosidase
MDQRPRITIVGAGGTVFPIKEIVDILSYPRQQEAEFVLYDPDDRRLQRTARRAGRIVEYHGLAATIRTTTDRREALDGADFVLLTFAVGGFEAWRLDIEIPRSYGIDQTVGDTLGPGGVFRGLRSAPVLRAIAEDVASVAPQATIFNFPNPMAINCWALREVGANAVGLCYAIQESAYLAATLAGLDYERLRYDAAGINHLAWFTGFTLDGEDVYPRIRRAFSDRYPRPHLVGEDGRLRANPTRGWEPFDENQDDGLALAELLRTFGYLPSESSTTISEFVPWFRRSPAVTEAYLTRRWDPFRDASQEDVDADAQDSHQARLDRKGLGPLWEERTDAPLAAQAIEALRGGDPVVMYPNIANRMDDGDPAITNLPVEATVEVRCLVDGDGIHPARFGPLPPQCAALTMLNINVQQLAVRGALEGDRESIYQAIALDPLTASVLTLPEIRRMVDDLFEAQERWLPQFARANGSARSGRATPSRE